MLHRADLRLAGTVARGSGIGTGDTRLRGDRPGCGNDCRAALVHVVELLPVSGGFALVLELSGHGRCAGTAHGCNFSWLWACGNAPSTAVVGNATVVVHDNRAVVDVGDVDINAVDGAVVVEVIAVPVATVITDTGVAEAIVDATVEADMGAPKAAMEAPTATPPAPVTGGPEGSVVGRSAPGAGDPVVASGTPVPVAGGPEIVGRGGDGLLVDGQRGRGLIGVFDGLGLTFGVELVIGLGVLIGLILIVGRRSGLLRRVLLGALLGLGLRAGSQNLSLSWRGGGNRLLLAIVDWRHVRVGGVWAGVVGDGCVRCTSVPVATCGSDDRKDTKRKT